MIKRVLDITVSVVFLLVLSPLLLVIAAIIRFGDGGAVFYRGHRIGRLGRPFKMLKFRTMVLNADKIGGPSTPDDDPRITSIGRTLRKYKLDELPQLFNVLAGTMSLVGPRPEVESEVRTYTEEERALLSVRPGLTDMASLRFHDEGAILRGHADAHEAYRTLIRPEKIRLGLEYVHSRSLMLDLRIIFATLNTVVRSRLDSNP